MDWDVDQQWESDWWGKCLNTYGEETKQLVYAQKMGLERFHDGKSPYNFSVKGRVLDIGGGPTSILLKCPEVFGTVVDPCSYPKWVHDRYELANIRYLKLAGEDIGYVDEFDEVWIYNCLQHTQDPEKIIKNSFRAAPIIRIFEWVDTKITMGHPHSFAKDVLDSWLGGNGKIETLNGEGTCRGKCYYGIFTR